MQSIQLKKGVLVAIEGIDGTGKSTQTLRLSRYFKEQGIDAVNFREPSDGQYGREIRQLATEGRESVTPEEELALFINDRIENREKNIQPALDANRLVILDRYYFSTVAYQGALGLNPEMILKKNEAIAILPDLVIIPDIEVKIGLDRITNDRKESHDHFEGEAYLNKVREIFLSLKKPYIRVIDGARSEDILFEDMKHLIFNTISPYIDAQDVNP